VLFGLANLKTILSVAAFLGVYWALYGWWFALGFVLSIAIHEMGHYLIVRYYGLSAQAPVFIPGFGAYVKWQGSVDPVLRSRISLAGPLFGLLASVGAFAVYEMTGRGTWLAVAHVGAWINLLNMIPILIFDGAAAMNSLGQAERFLVALAAVALWYFFREVLFLAIGAAAAYRAFAREYPPSQSRSNTAYFVVLMVALGLMSSVAQSVAGNRLPGTTTGIP